jgi:hypothetical protein
MLSDALPFVYVFAIPGSRINLINIQDYIQSLYML